MLFIFKPFSGSLWYWKTIRGVRKISKINEGIFPLIVNFLLCQTYKKLFSVHNKLYYVRKVKACQSERKHEIFLKSIPGTETLVSCPTMEVDVFGVRPIIQSCVVISEILFLLITGKILLNTIIFNSLYFSTIWCRPLYIYYTILFRRAGTGFFVPSIGSYDTHEIEVTLHFLFNLLLYRRPVLLLPGKLFFSKLFSTRGQLNACIYHLKTSYNEI